RIPIVKAFLISLAGLLFAEAALAQDSIRPPAVPLVACDPYFSIWSQADRLTDVATTHWTGKPHRLSSQITIDGKSVRVLGAEPAGVPAMRQKSVAVWPTRTIYQFESAGIALTLTFTTPSLPESIDVLSWPLTYVSYSAKSVDGKAHKVSVTFEAAAEIAVNDPGQNTVWSTPAIEG